MLGQCHNFETMLQRTVAQKVVVMNHPVFALHRFNTGLCVQNSFFFFQQTRLFKRYIFIWLIRGEIK